MSSVHEPKPQCDPGLNYLADKSEIEEPVSNMLSLLWAALLIITFFYAVNVYLKRTRKKLGLSVEARFKSQAVSSVDFSEGETKRRLFLIGLEQSRPWSSGCISSIIDKLNAENYKCEVHVVGLNIPSADKYHSSVTCYYSADLSEPSHLQKLFPADKIGFEDIIVYFASPAHLNSWISHDREKRSAWDAPVNTITHAFQEESSVKRIILVSSAYVLCESAIGNKLKAQAKAPVDSAKPKTSVNNYFSHLRSVEDLLLNKASKNLDTYILRSFETQELLSSSPYARYLRQRSYIRDQKTFVTAPPLLANRITLLITGEHVPARKVVNVGEEMDAQDFMQQCTPDNPCSLIYFIHSGLHKPLIHLNHFCYHFFGYTPFGVYFNYSTYALYKKFIPLPST